MEAQRLADIKGERIRKRIYKELDKVIRKGARGVIMVNPDGFIFLSAGDVSPTDETLAAYMMVLFPRARNQMKLELRRSLGALLHKEAEILDLLGNVTINFADRQYIGVYVEDYAILASIKEGADVQELRTSLVRAIIEVIRELQALRELTMITKPPVAHEAPYPGEAEAAYVPVPAPTATAKIPKETFKSPAEVYRKIKGIILETRRNLRQRGDWNAALSGLEGLLITLTMLVERFPEYGENPAIRSILNWVSTTTEKVRRGASASGHKPLPDPYREKLEKSLIQILNYLRKILLLGSR